MWGSSYNATRPEEKKAIKDDGKKTLVTETVSVLRGTEHGELLYHGRADLIRPSVNQRRKTKRQSSKGLRVTRERE